jgi:membrane protein DedA with SNARE-associated domain
MDIHYGWRFSHHNNKRAVVEGLIQQILNADPAWAYLLLFISAFVENIFPPIPGDTVTVIGAYLVGRGKLNFWGVFGVTTAGSILGFMALFILAYLLEWKIIERYNPRWLSRSRIEKVEGKVHKYGYGVILFNRFLSGARSVISIVAGLSKMKPFHVFYLALIGCAVWNGLLIYLGAIVGKHWEDIMAYLKTYNRIVLGMLIIAIISGFLFYFLKRNKNA